MHVQPTRYPSAEWTLACDDELVQRVVVQLQSRLGSQVGNFQMAGRENGLVLRGQVTTYYAKQMAQEVVMEVSGLAILANDIQVQCFALTQHGTVAAK
ncbi:MAG: BON domain-containing protein [Planctomycetota bacterium]